MHNSEKCGCIVGRFQTASLSGGHQELFEYVLGQGHNLNIVVLAKSCCNQPTVRNPLDVDTRRRMIEEAYPGKFVITYLEDYPISDNVWSAKFDDIIYGLAGKRDVVLYGSRDSFIDHYFGKYQTHEYKQKQFCSASESRQHIGKVIQSSADFRAGVIWATQNQYDKVFPTVDVAILEVNDEHELCVYLCKKKQYESYMFIGGFVDPIDKSYEEAARREAYEETGIGIHRIKYLASAQIDDPRYRYEKEKIITNFFMAMNNLTCVAEAQDDIDELNLVKVDDLKREDFAEDHRPLFDIMTANLSDYWNWIMRGNTNTVTQS